MQFFRLTANISVILFLAGTAAFAQLPSFSGFWLTPQLTAPTAMAGDDAYQVSAHYRMQGSEENNGYKTYLLSGQIPLYDRANTHFGTVGISLIREESGASYLFTTSGAMLTYLYDAAISYRHHLVGGVQGAYYGRKLNWSKVTTSNQFINGGFDPARSSGEYFPDNPGQAFVANAGLAYYFTDFDGEPVIHIGTALTNVNRGSFTYLMESESQAVPVALLSYAHFRLISNPYFEFVSDLYWRSENKVSDLMGGFRFRKGTKPRANVADNHLGAGLYYSQDHTGILALQLVQPNWIIGLSYDMVFGNRPLRSMQNAVEVSLGWRALREKKGRNPYRRNYRKRLPWKRKKRLPWQ